MAAALLGVARRLPSAAAAAGGASTQGTITQLSFATPNEIQDSPAISGTKVLWTDNNGLLTNFVNEDIILDDLASSGPPQNLSNTPNDNEFLEDIDGNYAIWTRQNIPSPGDILLYNLSTGVATTIASSGGGLLFQRPTVGGNGPYAVFVRSTTQDDIDGYNIGPGCRSHHR